MFRIEIELVRARDAGNVVSCRLTKAEVGYKAVRIDRMKQRSQID